MLRVNCFEVNLSPMKHYLVVIQLSIWLSLICLMTESEYASNEMFWCCNTHMVKCCPIKHFRCQVHSVSLTCENTFGITFYLLKSRLTQNEQFGIASRGLVQLATFNCFLYSLEWQWCQWPSLIIDYLFERSFLFALTGCILKKAFSKRKTIT